MKESWLFNSNAKYILKATLFCIVFTGLYVLVYFITSPVYDKSERVAHAAIGTIVALLTTFIFLKFDKKSFADIGLLFDKTTLKKFFAGVLAGIGIMGLLAMSTIYFSDFRIVANKNSNILIFFC